MASPQHRLPSRYRGTLLGAAIADALAFPYRNYSRHFLLSVARPLSADYETPPTGYHPRGQFTAQTQGWLAVVDSILERGALEADDSSARLALDHLIPLWRDMLVVQPDDEMSAVMQRVVRGHVEWNEAALPAGHAGSAAVCRALPVGLWNCRFPAEVPARVATLVEITHRDRRVLAVAAGVAATVAASVLADDLILGDLLDQVASACAHFEPAVGDAVLDMPRYLSQTESRAIELILDVVADDAHRPRDDGIGDYCVPSFLIALYQFLQSPCDFARAVDRSLRVGGAASTTAALTGAFCGAYLGYEHLPRRLVEGLVDGAEIAQRAGALYDLRRSVLRGDRAGRENDGGALDDDPSERTGFTANIDDPLRTEADELEDGDGDIADVADVADIADGADGADEFDALVDAVIDRAVEAARRPLESTAPDDVPPGACGAR